MGWLGSIMQKLFGEKMIRQYVGSVVRTAMAALAGVFLASGAPEIAQQIQSLSPQIADALVAVVLYLMAQGWSIQQKLATKKN